MKLIIAECGHSVFIKSPGFPLLGESKIRELLKKTTAKYCPDCIRKTAIKCAWCGKQIIADEKITLYTPISRGHIFPKHAVVYTRAPLRVIGCVRRGCLDKQEDVAGIWRISGKVEHIPSEEEKIEQIAKDKNKRGLW